MTPFEQSCDAVIRAAYQISGLTGSRVESGPIMKVVPLEAEEFDRVLQALQTRGFLSRNNAGEGVTLTPAGIAYAATVAPVSEPPMFSDL